MINTIRKSIGFIKRDYQIESSYKLNFLMRGVNSVALLIFFLFLSRMIQPNTDKRLDSYGGNYFTFVVVGLAFARYMSLSLKIFAESIRLAQVTGCLEAMLSSQSSPLTIVIMSSLYSLISATVQFILIFFVAGLAFGVDFSQANYSAAALAMFLSVLTFIGFGVISAATIVLVKKGDPVAWVFSGLGIMLGGAYFPVSVMPVWLQKMSVLIPMTYSLDALRLALLKGHTVAMLARPLGILATMALIIVPVGLLMFWWCVQKGRRDGTLMQY